MKPSEVVSHVVSAIEHAFPDPIEVEGRIVSRRESQWSSSQGRTYRFINLTLVDSDASGGAITLPASVTRGDLERMLGRSGLDPDEVTAEGALVSATGTLHGMKNTGAPQLRVTSIAPTGLSDDMLARRRVAKRIADEGLGDLRHIVAAETWLVRRVVVIGTRTGFEDVHSGFRAAKHLPAPAACYHEISPQSATAVVDVPRLILGHLDRGVDAVLLAFGGHLPVPNPWDTEPIIDAIVAAHRAGVPVLAGFAHQADQPLTKRVAFDLKQASAAAHRIVGRNDEHIEPLLRLPQALRAASVRHGEHVQRVRRASTHAADRLERLRAQQEEQLGARVVELARDVSRSHRLQRERLDRVAGRSQLLAAQLHEQATRLRRAADSICTTTAARRQQEHRRVVSLVRAPAQRLRQQSNERARALAAQAPRIVQGMDRLAATRRDELGSSAERITAGLRSRIERTGHELRSTSLISEMMHHGWAVVSRPDGTPVTAPAVGDDIAVQTIAARFTARVESVEGTSDE